MAPKEWARVNRSGAHGLRRGAWYPVVSNPKTGMLIVNVSRHNIPVARNLVELRSQRPKQWSVVQFDATDPGAERANQANIGLTYLVCPACRGRAPLDAEKPQEATCSQCGGEFRIDWAQTS